MPVTGAWTPPDGETVLSGLAMIGGLPIAGLSAYAAIQMWGRANGSEEAPAET